MVERYWFLLNELFDLNINKRRIHFNIRGMDDFVSVYCEISQMWISHCIEWFIEGAQRAVPQVLNYITLTTNDNWMCLSPAYIGFKD